MYSEIERLLSKYRKLDRMARKYKHKHNRILFARYTKEALRVISEHNSLVVRWKDQNNIPY
jgi:hypothetical protein